MAGESFWAQTNTDGGGEMVVLHSDYAALADELKWARNEFAAMIDLIPPDCRVRVCEGGGPENVRASCAVSVLKMAQQLAASRAVLGETRDLLSQLYHKCERYLSEQVPSDADWGSDEPSLSSRVAAALSAPDGGTR